jgi:putative hemolysin
MTATTDQYGGVPRSGKDGRTESSARTKLAEMSSAHYRMRLAASEADVRAAQLLRFMVFNVELREGLEQSYATCLDADVFDPICDHLLVEDTRTGEVIGTYRLQTGMRAKENRGYYSEQEFDFSPYEMLRHEMVELGRACVHSNHRTLAVLSLLWKGIANYSAQHGCHYLIGCSSLTSQDPAVGIAAYHDLERYLVPEELRTMPLPAFACATGHPAAPAPKIPKLLAAYLTFGARICGPPAMDREFKTIDFLTLQDLHSLPAKVAARFLG